MRAESTAGVLIAWVSGIRLFEPSALSLQWHLYRPAPRMKEGEGVGSLGEECSRQNDLSIYRVIKSELVCHIQETSKRPVWLE